MDKLERLTDRVDQLYEAIDQLRACLPNKRRYREWKQAWDHRAHGDLMAELRDMAKKEGYSTDDGSQPGIRSHFAPQMPSE